MDKRQFRSRGAAGSEAPRYPTLERFDALERRRFLALLGGGALGSLLGCATRPVDTSDGGSARDRAAAQRDAWRDVPYISEGTPYDLDSRRDLPRFIGEGVAPPLDARRDLHSTPHLLDGMPSHPDSRRDIPQWAHDSGGKPDMMKAKIDLEGGEK